MSRDNIAVIDEIMNRPVFPDVLMDADSEKPLYPINVVVWRWFNQNDNPLPALRRLESDPGFKAELQSEVQVVLGKLFAKHLPEHFSADYSLRLKKGK
ncbi:hypothetical protein [Brucella anthropi]|uniref:hypothetical protein n=1 Tax=Brucella anthropi TaxID=529 RepID=UPI001CFE205E|nr:hypothetical protein [Brucella anthropi]